MTVPYRSGSFNAEWWRTTLARMAATLTPQPDYIAPFGFEILRDPDLLRRDVVRLYIYVRVDSGEQRPAVDRFAEHLLETLREEEPAFFESVRFFMRPSERREIHPGGHRSIRVSCVVSQGPLLDDYGRYLVVTPKAIAEGTLREVADFASSRSSRRYLFQLTLMLSRLFAAEHPPLALTDVERLRSIIRRLAPVTEADARSPDGTSPEDEESRCFEQIVDPYARSLCAALAATHDEMTVVRAVDLHSGRSLTADAPESVLDSKLAAVRTAYALVTSPSTN